MATQWTAQTVAGQVLSNTTLNTIGAAWENYTPALSAWIQGNGTYYARYSRTQQIISFEMIFTVGSTTTFALGPIFSLPITPRVGSNWAFGFNGFATDASTGIQYPLRAWPVATNNFYPVVTQTTTTYGDTTYVSGTAPMSWTTNDKLVMYGTYEAA